jgi:glycosyltransferase involved in cell wall biosynthesis
MFNLDIIIPVYNEGENILSVVSHIKKNVKTKYQILICYDNDDDNLFEYREKIFGIYNDIVLVKNKYIGACGAIKTGLLHSTTDVKIVYPCDDLINGCIIDGMYKKFLEGNEIVAPSRFMKGGSMKNCPIIKEILVRFSSYTLFVLSSIPIEDASNGFRLFSKKIIDTFEIESNLGFAYSLELLVKTERAGYKICQIPSQWNERTVGSSKFKIFVWLPQYLKWYFYGLQTSWLFKKK